MRKVNLDKLSRSEREDVKQYQKYQKLRKKYYIRVTSVFATLALIANGLVFAAFGIQRLPFTRGTERISVYNKEEVVYVSNEPPKTTASIIVESDFTAPPDKVAYIGEARIVSEDTPDVKIRDYTEPVEIPEKLLKDVDRDELYSRIIHDPAFMAEVLELSEATTSTQFIIGEDANDPILHEPSHFVITSVQVKDSLEATRVPTTSDDLGPIRIFEAISTIAYPIALAIISWGVIDLDGISGKRYRRLMKKARDKE